MGAAVRRRQSRAGEDLGPCGCGMSCARGCGRSCFGIGANVISARSSSSISSARSRCAWPPGSRSTRRAGRRCGMFGSVESLKEECRDARGTGVWDALVRDTRHAARRLLRDWRFSVPAVLLLGLGIGANTAIFSIVNATLFRPSPFADSYAAGRALPEHQGRRARHEHLPGVSGHGHRHQRVRARDGGDASSYRELSRGEPESGAQRYRGIRDTVVPGRARHPAVTGPLVHRRRRTSGRPAGGRHRSSGVDDALWRGSGRDRPHGLRAGPADDDHRCRTSGLPQHIRHRPGHRLLAADRVGAWSAYQRAARGGRGPVLREGAAARRRHGGAGAGGDGRAGPASRRGVSRRGPGHGHQRLRDRRCAHPPAGGHVPVRARLACARGRRPGAGRRLQQPDDAAPRPCCHPRKGSVHPPGDRRHALAGRAPPAGRKASCCRWRAVWLAARLRGG